MNNTQLLPWDTSVLGVSVAKILSPALGKSQLQSTLETLKDKKVQLVYWAIHEQDLLSREAAQTCGGYLVDKKVSYFIDLSQRNLVAFPPPNVVIHTGSANLELENIALEIAKFSRFSRDPYLNVPQISALYKAWIHNACKKIVAKVTLVIKAHQLIVGMACIDQKYNRTNLSLLGVNPFYQGKGLGKQLVHAAQSWSILQNYRLSQVVTQKTNRRACLLYEHCGYQIEKIEYFYHFWLQ